MSKRLLLVLGIPLLLVLFLPASSWADASVVQDSCVTIGNGEIRIYFTVVNFSLPEVLCDLHFFPEPQPVLPECEHLDCNAAMGWTCFLNPLGGSDFFANTLNDCVPQGTGKGGFYFTLDPGFCCYIVQFTGPDGSVMLEQEECFTLCDKVGAESRSWGNVKDIYR
jgi:hypothetical protein